MPKSCGVMEVGGFEGEMGSVFGGGGSGQQTQRVRANCTQDRELRAGFGLSSLSASGS